MRGKKRRVEEQYGRDLREILITLFEQHGSCQAVADELAVSYVTVRNWMSDVGLELVARAVPSTVPPAAPSTCRDSNSAMRPLFDLADYTPFTLDQDSSSVPDGSG